MLFGVILAGGVVSVTSLYLYARHSYHSLASQVKSTDVSASEREQAYASGEIESLPAELVENPNKFRVLHVKEEAARPMKTPSKDENLKDLFTKLLRRNMSCFSRAPQSYILRMMATTEEQKRSFSRAHIEALDFEKGDLCCGFNRVLKRDPTKAEIDLVPPGGMGDFSGRLIIALYQHDGGMVLRTQTVQWTQAGSSSVLPLERGVANFLHEMVSWWLIVTGQQYLESIMKS